MKMNVAASNLMFQRNLSSPVALKYQIIFVQGFTHTALELENNFNNVVGGTLTNINTLITQIAGRGGKVVAFAELLPNTDPVLKNNFVNLLDFNWSKLNPTIIASGTPDWFLIYVRNSNVAYNAAGPCVWSVYGTITNFSGNGDLKVGNRNMLLGQMYSMGNFRLKREEVI
jgi:hypothetical protein